MTAGGVDRPVTPRADATGLPDLPQQPLDRPASAGRGFACVPGRAATAAARPARSSSGTPSSRKRAKPPERRERRARTRRVVRAERAREPPDRRGHDDRVEPERRGRHTAFASPCGDPVATTHALCERVAETEAGRSERRAARIAPSSSRVRAYRSRGRATTSGSAYAIAVAPAPAKTARKWCCSWRMPAVSPLRS